MPTHRLLVIDEPAPDTRTILGTDDGFDGPLITSEGNFTFKCGACGHVLARNVHRQQISNIVLHCGSCKAFNEKL